MPCRSCTPDRKAASRNASRAEASSPASHTGATARVTAAPRSTSRRHRCDLHTILRLPTGVFYAQGVKTNVLFFTRSAEADPAEDATKAVWIYDMRAGAPAYGKTNPLKRVDFAGFVAAFGDNPHGRAARKDEGETGRFRRFDRAALEARGDNLDIGWLKDTSAEAEDGLDTPEDVAAAIEGHLLAALEEIAALVASLG